ncbi:MAG: hypothetical protein IKV63_03225, partial [Clostridia bacterium]|nr:hypothetical protein [Clostridia bacterium]
GRAKRMSGERILPSVKVFVLDMGNTFLEIGNEEWIVAVSAMNLIRRDAEGVVPYEGVKFAVQMKQPSAMKCCPWQRAVHYKCRTLRNL